MSGLFDQITNYSPPLLTAGQVNYKGTWDAAANSPTLTSPPASTSKGDYYVVSAAGTRFGIDFAVGDWIISNGTAWEKVDLTDAVSSVFGRTGAVVGVSTDYSSVGITNTAIGASSPSTGVFTNAFADTLSTGFTSVAAAGTVTTLVVGSVRDWTVTGSGGQTYQLPDATTLRNGAMFQFNNNQSSGTIVVRNNSATTIATLQSGSYVEIILLSNATAAGSWDVHNQAPSNVSWSTNTFDYPGSITSATWNGTAVAINRGGTGQATAQLAINALAGAVTSGSYLRGNGTNVVMNTIQAADVPTLNQSTTGSAATLTTSRSIHGGSFNGSADVTNIIASTYGGTGNGFTKFSGPTTAERTFTLPDSNATLLYSGGALGTPASGTVTNLTGTASININGTVGATTANTGAFTTITGSGLASIADTIRTTGSATSPASGQGIEMLYVSAQTRGVVRAYDRSGSAALQLDINDTGGLVKISNGVAQVSSTGLAVTGAVTATGNVGLAVGTLLTLNGNNTAAGYALQAATAAAPYDFRFIGSSDSGTNRNFSFGYYTSDDKTNTWNPKVTINSYTGAVKFNAYGAGALTTDASGNITAASDERIKKNIRPFSRGISEILAINPILHGYTEESGLDQTRDDYAGFSAQQVQTIIPEAIGENANGMLSFSDRPVMAALVNAVKELSARLAALESK
jgi:hypothetical protein